MTNTIEKIKCLLIGWGPAGYTAPGTGCMAALAAERYLASIGHYRLRKCVNQLSSQLDNG